MRFHHKPDIPPSYDLHISPTARRKREGTIGSAGPDYWARENFQLAAVLSELFDISEARIELSATIDPDLRYDFFLVLPHEESWETTTRRIQQGIEKYYRVRIARETRSMEAYLLAAPDGISAVKESGEDVGGIGAFSVGTMQVGVEREEALTPAMLLERMRERFRQRFSTGAVRPPVTDAPVVSMSISGSYSMAWLCRMLERSLDRPVVDATNLHGTYRFDVRGGPGLEGFFRALRDQSGLVVTPARRDITVLVVRDDDARR